MELHDPYTPLLEEIFLISDDEDTEDRKRQILRGTRDFVSQLRQAYRSSPSNVDYEDRHKRAAYLLAYYPHNIESLYHVLNELPKDEMKNVFDKLKIRACFLGAGPAPEVIGWLKYVSEYFSTPACAIAYILDKYVDDWRIGQDITRYHLAPQYWTNRKLGMIPLTFDFVNLPNFAATMEEYGSHKYTDLKIINAFRASNFFVMQNCLNDQLKPSKAFLKTIISLFSNMKSGAIFVLLDLKLPDFQRFMRELEVEVVKQNLGRVLLNVPNKPRTYQSNFETPHMLLEELFADEDGLIPRKNTSYYATVIQRI